MSKIVVKADALCGKIFIPKGDYLVSAMPEQSGINLAGHGKDILIPAVKRPSKGICRTTRIQYYSGGGANWTLAVQLPNGRGEWVAFLQLQGNASGGGYQGGATGPQRVYELDPKDPPETDEDKKKKKAPLE